MEDLLRAVAVTASAYAQAGPSFVFVRMRVFAADFRKLHSQHYQWTRTNAPQPIKATPVSWLTRGPSGNSFSISTRSASPAIQSRFMEAAHEQEPHQHPAASKAERPMPSAGAHRTERTLPP